MTFTWRPLDRSRHKIRVLDLDGGIDNSPLSGRLRHVFLDGSEEAHYETISYAWVDTSLVASILIEKQCIHIPASAASALRSMRLANTSRTLWIDCICIDQEDTHEKGHQVGLLADIFGRSWRTLAFLGDDNDNTARRAFQDFGRVYDAMKFCANGVIDLATVFNIEIDDWSSLREELDMTAIEAILAKPYFTRLWIVQEIFLPTETIMTCGSWTIDFHTYIAAAAWLFVKGLRKSTTIGKWGAIAFWSMAGRIVFPGELTFSGILTSSVGLRCSEPRDGVFALLGILRLRAPDAPCTFSLAPDYTMSVVDVYCDAMRACLDRCEGFWNLETYGCERDASQMIEDLPTWIPSWYLVEEDRVPTATQFPYSCRIWSDGNIAMETPLLPGSNVGRVLTVQAVVLETILKHSDDVLTSHGNEVDFVNERASFLARAADLSCDGEVTRLNDVLTAGVPDANVLESWIDYLTVLKRHLDILMEAGRGDEQAPVVFQSVYENIGASSYLGSSP